MSTAQAVEHSHIDSTAPPSTAVPSGVVAAPDVAALGPVDPSCAFCAIATGDAPAHVVFADDVAVAFLDRTPLFAGHTLVVPRFHHVTLPDLPAEQVGPYFERVRQAAIAVREGMGAAGTFVAMNNTVSQSVPHLHTHVVPRNPKDGLKGFFWPRRRYSDDAEAADAAERVQRAWASG